ncbi:hypothetical protein ACFSM5_15640 [Lacibacterium aquatile]|uniref:Lipoprotein n=1 Tax=Lacibacterium aquatile TaxID=1168082 RepID=A0ABW5DY28_9PROT
MKNFVSLMVVGFLLSSCRLYYIEFYEDEYNEAFYGPIKTDPLLMSDVDVGTLRKSFSRLCYIQNWRGIKVRSLIELDDSIVNGHEISMNEWASDKTK